MKNIWLRFAIVVVAFFPSIACIHPPVEYPGKLGSKIQEYLFYKEGSFVHMVSNQRVQAKTGLPTNLAWVIPVPSVPKSYAEESDTLFKRLYLASLGPPQIWKSGGVSKPRGTSSIKVHETVFVGKYEITPVEILDVTKGSEINQWLSSNGYHKVPIDGLKYYLAPHACFLAVKVKGLKGREELLKPLHIVYEASKVTVPLKFFANAGIFDVYLYTLSKNPLGPQPELAEKGFRYVSHVEVAKDRFGLKSVATEDTVLTRWSGDKINSKKNQISNWVSDPAIVY